MKQKRLPLKQKAVGIDHGKQLYDAVIFLLILLAVLWYVKI